MILKQNLAYAKVALSILKIDVFLLVLILRYCSSVFLAFVLTVTAIKKLRLLNLAVKFRVNLRDFTIRVILLSV
nr:MAG TPA: hypothetical protein [Inoviridae sp.]